MINFFRKTRSQLLTEHRFSKYLLYAIGEIILVVIGILIAIKINNWNQNLNYMKLADDYVENVSNDLKHDTLVFGKAIKNLKHLEKAKESGLKMDSYDDLSLEDLDAIMDSQYFNIRVNDNSFSQMNNNEVLKLQTYQEIFKNLNFYYTLMKDYLDNFNDWEVQSAQKEIKFWNEQNDFEIEFWDNDSIPTRQSPQKRKEAIINILNSNKGRNMTKLSLLRVQTMHQMYVAQKASATRLLEKIDSLEVK